MDLRFELPQLAEFVARGPEAVAVYERELKDTAYAAGAQVLSQAHEYVPVDTGNLKAAIGPVEVSGGLPLITTLVPVGSQAPYAAAIEFGRGPVTIRARNAKALRFTVGGATVFARSVNQPARPARPFMGKALQTQAKNIERVFGDAVQRALDWWGRGS